MEICHPNTFQGKLKVKVPVRVQVIVQAQIIVLIFDSVFECSNDDGNTEEVLNLLNNTTTINELVPDDQVNEVVDFEALYMEFVRETEEERIKPERNQRSKTL